MIYEFAVDPEALNNWRTFIYVIEKFGVSKGRLISRFPKRWERAVLDSYKENSVVNKSKIIEILSKVKELYYYSGRVYDTNKKWIDNAIEQHNLTNFRAILTSMNIENNSDVLNIDEFDESNEKFKISTGMKVKRKAKDMGDCIGSLLNISKEIIFVDPHFAPDATHSRFTNPLKEFLKYIDINKYVRVEYHIKQKANIEYFENCCQENISHLLPERIQLKFVRWQDKGLTESLHARYILTDRGGVSVENGLDEGQGEDTTDINLLDDALYKQRWEQYQKETSPFKFVDEIVIG